MPSKNLKKTPTTTSVRFEINKQVWNQFKFLAGEKGKSGTKFAENLINECVEKRGLNDPESV